MCFRNKLFNLQTSSYIPFYFHAMQYGLAKPQNPKVINKVVKVAKCKKMGNYDIFLHKF